MGTRSPRSPSLTPPFWVMPSRDFSVSTPGTCAEQLRYTVLLRGIAGASSRYLVVAPSAIRPSSSCHGALGRRHGRILAHRQRRYQALEPTRESAVASAVRCGAL